MTVTDAELHIFCDASEKAYVAVAYWRWIESDEKIQLSFITEKSRVAPLKVISIPRLELQAALIGARLATMIQSEHNINVSRRIFWTDSKTVLQWIKGRPRSCKVFVAHKLAEIEESTCKSEWRWTPSVENVADDATHDVNAKIKSGARWLEGPSFLLRCESTWPQINYGVAGGQSKILDPELRAQVTMVYAQNTSVPDIERFSSHKRLIQTTAQILYVVELFRGLPRMGITQDHIRKAELMWVKQAQQEDYSTELEDLHAGRPIQANSNLAQLSRMLDENGLLRVHERILAAEMIDNLAKFPMILDGKNRYTRLLVMRYHDEAGHGSAEMIINEIRQKYWIPRIRQVVRSISANCQICKVNRCPRFPELATCHSLELTTTSARLHIVASTILAP